MRSAEWIKTETKTFWTLVLRAHNVFASCLLQIVYLVEMRNGHGGLPERLPEL